MLGINWLEVALMAFIGLILCELPKPKKLVRRFKSHIS